MICMMIKRSNNVTSTGPHWPPPIHFAWIVHASTCEIGTNAYVEDYVVKAAEEAIETIKRRIVTLSPLIKPPERHSVRHDR